jgi:hypothetical protein
MFRGVFRRVFREGNVRRTWVWLTMIVDSGAEPLPYPVIGVETDQADRVEIQVFVYHLTEFINIPVSSILFYIAFGLDVNCL